MTPAPVDAAELAGRPLRYFDFCMAAFVTILIGSNLIAASKPAQFGPFDLFGGEWGPYVVGAGIFFFPLSYVLGDVLTEVYGYARARRCVWAGFGASVFISFMAWVIVALPPAARYADQAALEAVFGATPRIFAASLAAFWAGEFANAAVLARLKVLTGGKRLWTRTIGSTAVGQGVDTLIFYPLAFYGVWDNALILAIMGSNYLAKVAWEAALTPVTYRVVAWFKRAEGVDVFDRGTDLTPFTVKV